MIIYSQTIEVFLEKCLQYTCEILFHEMNLHVRRTRFEFQNRLYPISLVCFENNSQLAYFNPGQWTIGLNKKLIYQAKENTLKDILRHELAHYYCHLIYGNQISSHGPEFKDSCLKFNWNDEISKASLNLEKNFQEVEGNLKFEAIAEKIKKLFSLSSSDNIHEAELATKKANELLLKYNLELIPEKEIEYVVKSLISANKRTPAMDAVYEILEYFLVKPVFNHTGEGISLEITGTRVNVEIADYMANYLLHEFERLYEIQKKLNPHLRGIQAKKSFMKGLCLGLKEKLNSSHSTLSNSKELILINRNLKEVVRKIHGGLRSSHTQNNTCHESLSAGVIAGQKMQLRAGVNQDQKAKTLRLDFWK